MRIIRPSQITNDERQARRNLLIALGMLVLALAFLAAGFIFSNNLVLLVIFAGLALAVAGGASWFGIAFNKHRQRQNAVKKLASFLGQTLDDSYMFFENLMLPGRSTVGVIDGVLLGPFGATVLQIETNRSDFIVDGDTWYRCTGAEASKATPKPLSQSQDGPAMVLPRRRLDYSPAWLAIRAAREVKAWLSVRGLPQVSVQPLVILSEGKLRSIQRSSAPAIESGQFAAYLQENILNDENAKLAEGVVEQIADRLQTNAEHLQQKLTESV